MSVETTALLSILAFFCFGALFLLCIAILLAVAFFVFARRASAVFGEAGRALHAGTATYFANIVPTLLPWQPHALADLSSHLEMNGIAGPGSLHYRGAIKSLSQPHADWLAFDLRLNWRARGALVLRASNRAVQLEIVSHSADGARVRVDKIPFGGLRDHAGAIELCDVTQRRIGQYARYNRQPTLRPYGVEDVTPEYGAVEIGNRAIAGLNYNLIPNQSVAQLDQPIPALLRDLAPELTSQEEDWLLALIALEVYYRVARKVSDARRRHRSWSMR